MTGPSSPPPHGPGNRAGVTGVPMQLGPRDMRLSRLAAAAPPGLLVQIARIEGDFDAKLSKVSETVRKLHSTADTEAIHDVRVSLRRLNAALRMWREILRPRATKRARRRLRKMRQSLGPVRELEVDVTRLAKLSPTLPPESRVALEGFLLDLHHELDRRRRRAAHDASPHAVERLMQSVTRATRELAQHPATLLEPQLLARVHIDQSRERALASLSNSLETDDDVQLHAARVDLKKWRYALETSAALFDSGVPLEPLRDLQSALGDVHDLAVLRDRLLRRVGKLRDANMVTHADALNPALEALTTERAQTLEKARRLGARLAETLPGVTPLTLAARPQNP